MKVIIRIIILVLFAILLAVWSPWTNWDLSVSGLLGYQDLDRYAGLQVTSLGGELAVYVDDELLGRTEADAEPLELFQIAPGEHRVKLVRTSDPPGYYWEFNQSLNFVEGIDIVIAYDLAANEQLSEGHVLSVEEAAVGDQVGLEIRTFPANAQVFVDGLESSSSIEQLDLGAQHQTKVSADGYEPLEFMILPDSQEERDKLNGYNLLLTTNQMLIPIETYSI